MKKLLFALVSGCVPALVSLDGASAQSLANAGFPELQKNVALIDNVTHPVKDNLVDLGAISPKAQKDFAKTYKNVTVENWVKSEDGFSAKFISNGVKNTIFYNTRGKWVASLKAYVEDKLPYPVRDIIKREYYDFSITYVEEVETIDSHGTPTYVIYLEDKNNFKMVTFTDGQLNVREEFARS